MRKASIALACSLALGVFTAAAGAQAPTMAALAMHEKVAFEANVVFDSDKSDLRAASRDALDEFIARIQGLDSQTILAAGYADRRGRPGANKVLSEERVGVVKAYLVGKGIAAQRVRTAAWGDTRPHTAPAQCGDANNAKNVACLQPDRRVFIQISGTRPAK